MSVDLLRAVLPRNRRRSLAGFASLVALWELVGHLTAGGLVPFSAVVIAGGSLLWAGHLLDPATTSLGRMVVGYLLAVAIGIPVGAAMGFSEPADALFDPPVRTLFVTSVASLLPLLLGIIGSGFGFYVVVVFLFAVFHIALTVQSGVETVDPALVETGRVFGAEGWTTYRHVLLPAAVPHVAAALRLGATRSVKGMVVGELWVYAGFGSLLHSYQRYSQTDSALAVVLVLMLLSVGLVRLVALAERRFAPWTAVESDR